MPYNPTYHKPQKKSGFASVVPILLFFVIIIGASFYAGMLWERMQHENVKDAAGEKGSQIAQVPDSSVSSVVSSNESYYSQSTESKPSNPTEQQMSSSSEESSASSVPESSLESQPPEESQSVDSQSSNGGQALVPGTVSGFEPLVGKQTYVSMDYFDDAVFIGDSVSDGLSYYGVLEERQVLADTSVTFESVLYRTPYTDLNGNYVSTYDAVVERAPKKIYIMLGANGVEWLTAEKMVSMYETFLTTLQELLPDSIIYVQSVLPVTATLDSNPNRDLTNAKIDAYNQQVYNLCGKLGVHYLNVTESFKDENGCLPEEASPLDGLHFSVKYYQIWLEYLRNHALPVQSSTLSAENSTPGLMTP